MASAQRTASLEEIQLEPVAAPSYSRQQSELTHRSWHWKPPGEKWKVEHVKKGMKKSIADFFGVGEENPEEQLKWRKRSVRLHSNIVVGGSAPPLDTADSVFDVVDAAHPATPRIIDPYRRPRRQDSRSSRGSHMVSRQISHVSTASSAGTCRRSMRAHPHRLSRKDSVIKMAYDGMKGAMGSKRKSFKRKPTVHSRSFTPNSISSFNEEERSSPPSTPCNTQPSTEGAAVQAAPESEFERVPPDTPASLMSQGMESRAYYSEDSLLDDVFFDTPTPTAYMAAPFSHPRAMAAMAPIPEKSVSEIDSAEKKPLPDMAADEGDTTDSAPVKSAPLASSGSAGVPVTVEIEEESDKELLPPAYELRPTKSGWQVGRHQPEPLPGTPDTDLLDGPSFTAMGRMASSVIDSAFDNSDRREIGKGFVGNLFEREYRRERIDSEIKQQMDEMDDHRPYFTYWVTFVQIVVYIIAIAVYGIAPIGVEETEVKGQVMKPSLAIQVESYFERDNLWIGPRQADLIHMGAKYSPCMRRDENIEKALALDRKRENETACCINNDESGCVQLSKDQCSETLSNWHKWHKNSIDSGGRTSGSVCGQDPKYCLKPLPIKDVSEWEDDITTWPVCEKAVTSVPSDYPHMNCELVGRPCCIGIQGECIIATSDECEFRRGYFHPDITLCSQVSCMNEICGMIPFNFPDKPDQFYRLWTSLFLHAGILQLLITVLFQVFMMRDLEKLAGWLRIGIIYIGSGIAGSLASAIFLPYYVEAGPAGSQFGLLACLFAEVIQNWPIIRHPWWAFGKLCIMLVILFIVGLLPFVDNYAHLIGFVFGFLLSFALLPYITFGRYDRTRKIIGIVLCLLSAIGVFVMLIILFYVSPVYDCPNCHYFNCIPITRKFCKSMEVEVRRDPNFYY